VGARARVPLSCSCCEIRKHGRPGHGLRSTSRQEGGARNRVHALSSRCFSPLVKRDDVATMGMASLLHRQEGGALCWEHALSSCCPPPAVKRRDDEAVAPLAHRLSGCGGVQPPSAA
jgi:hypothetical protein